MLTLCSERGIRIDRTVTEIGSGRGRRRTKLRKLLGDPTVATIVVEHRNRWPASGWSTWKRPSPRTAAPWSCSTRTELADDLARDLTEVLTSMCRRLYGRRSAARRRHRPLRRSRASPTKRRVIRLIRAYLYALDPTDAQDGAMRQRIAARSGSLQLVPRPGEGELGAARRRADLWPDR